MLSRRKFVFVVVVLGLAGAMCFTLARTIHKNRSFAAERRTMQELNDVRRAIQSAVISYRRLPSDVSEMLKFLDDPTLGTYKYWPRVRKTILDGDGWGQALIFEFSDESVVIRSVGANGVDEHGENDDIERQVILSESVH